MGVSNSRAETCEALRLCKERKKFMKQAIDSRHSLAAAHVVYIQSLRNIGIALRRYAESQVCLESSSATDAENPPSHLSPLSTLGYVKSSGTSAVTVNLSPSKISNSNKVYVDDVESSPFRMPPPPPPPPELGCSWDYFDPTNDNRNFKFVGHDGFQVNFNDTSVHKQFNDKDADLDERFVTPPESVKRDQKGHDDDNLVAVDSEVSGALICKNGPMEQCDSKDSCLTEGERENLSEFSTHRAKDFLSSIKDIENHFFRASKLGNEVSRMLEANNIHVSYSEATCSSTAVTSSLLLLNCCRDKTRLVSHEPPHVTKTITWKRSTSSHSSESRNPPVMPSNDDNEFIEDLCMIAGSHSSTLDRLYAWERKLYDEVKASESIRKEYDRKCDHLRHQFAKDQKAHVIDKSRAVAKDLHSRMTVALHTVNSISKRIQKMRDQELQPQLIALIHGLIKMWKAMLECHHTQYITISSAYHSKISRTDQPKTQIISQLHHEIQSFGLSFAALLKCYVSYIESINSWLQNCITLPKERVKGRRAFSPRRALAPPIFVICRDWSVGIRTLPCQKLSDAIKHFLLVLEELEKKEIPREETKNDDDDVMGLDLNTIHSSLTKVLDRLTKFAEASLNMYEDIKEKSETARNAYSNYRQPPPRGFSI